MAELTVQTVTRSGDGLDPNYVTAAGGGDTVQVVTNLFLHVKNGDVGAHTVTVATPGTVAGLAISDLTATIPAAEERMIGPIDQYFRASDGLASITYDGVTSVTIAAIRV